MGGLKPKLILAMILVIALVSTSLLAVYTQGGEEAKEEGEYGVKTSEIIDHTDFFKEQNMY